MWKEFFLWEFRVVAKVYAESSQFGIPGLERVSKMSIYLGKKMIYNFDRSLDFSKIPDFLWKEMLHQIAKFLLFIQVLL